MTGEKGIVIRRAESSLPSPISKNQAMYLLKTIWPGAPEQDIIKAGILCQQYGLNPLMRQVYLIPFKNKDGVETWAIVLGIKATRQIAQQALRKRGITYSYVDGPRMMTPTEQERVFGSADSSKLWAIVILGDDHGNTFPGYGFWKREIPAYGAEKGNTQANMAFIRAERNALDKLAPGELPDLDVGDDAYIAGDYKVAIEAGKQEFDKQVDDNIEMLYGDGTEKQTGGIKTPKEQKDSNKPPAEQGKPVESHPDAMFYEPIDVDWLRERMKELEWSNQRMVEFIKARYNVAGKSVTETVGKLSKAQREDFVSQTERLCKEGQ